MTIPQKELTENLRVEWKRLWRERMDDKVMAEGVATDDYCDLFVEKGTVIHATRDFKALNFKEILEQHQVDNAERYVSPDCKVGGWNKFIKDYITIKQPRRRVEPYLEKKQKKQQLKKGGRGWLRKY